MSKYIRKTDAENMGRPKVDINREQFEELCSLFCTLSDISGFFKCSEDTIQNWCKNEYGETFSVVYKMFLGAGKTSLRRNQFALSKTNATMAIWLGKQYLDQKDIQYMDSADGGFNVNIYNDLENRLNDKD